MTDYFAYDEVLDKGRPNGSAKAPGNGGRTDGPRKSTFAASNWSAKPKPRHWEYGRHYITGSLACTIADGGVGKTALDLTEDIAMATGRDLLGVKPKRRFRVLYWNGEEPHEEIRRRVFAICQRFHVDPAELDGCLFTSSGLEHPINASDESCGLIGLKHFIDDYRIEVVTLDPFISCHRAPENDNTALDIVAKRLAALADSKKVSIEVAHHTRKPAHGEADTYTVHDARGAVALVNAARTVRTINRMTESEASVAGVQNRRAYVRIDDGKANYAALGETQWFQISEENLDNFDGVYGPDSVGVIAPWRFPGAFDGVSVAHLDEVVERAASGRYRADPQSPNWIGVVIADVLQLDPAKDVKRIKAILKQWIENGALKPLEKISGGTVLLRLANDRSPRLANDRSPRHGSGEYQHTRSRPAQLAQCRCCRAGAARTGRARGMGLRSHPTIVT